MKNSAGFTLIEVLVVLGVIAALTAAISPAAFSYIRDAQRTQAQNDVNQIAGAIRRFMEHTAVPPYKNNTNSMKVGAKQSTPGAIDFDCLHGSSGIAFTTTTDLSAGQSWTSGAVQCQAASITDDTIENHLITNTPDGLGTKAYATTGKTAWLGPYLEAVQPDPWGNMYLVNIGKSDPGAATKKAVFAISAGPNGQLETGSDANRTSVVTAGGDDIIARIQ